MKVRVAIPSLLGLIVGASCTTGAFLCENSGECPGGTCESTGYCSFPDPECASGKRYGGLAGGGLAGECVPEGDDTSTESGADDSSSTASTTESTSLDTTMGPGTAVTGTTLTETGDTTGPPAMCGDGVEDPGEACDDGNEVDGDGCNNDCVISGTLLWERRDGGTGSDVYRDVVALGEGRVAVTGNLQGADDEAVVIIFDGDGAEVINESVPINGDAHGWGIDLLGGGDIAVAGFQPSDGSGFVTRYSQGGQEDWTLLSVPEWFDVAVGPDDEIFMSGRTNGAPALGVVSAEGVVLTPPPVTGFPGIGTAWDLDVSSAGTIFIGGDDDSDVATAAFILRVGNGGWNVGVPIQDASASATYGIRLDGDGHIDVSGGASLQSGDNGWAARLDVETGAADNTLTAAGAGFSNIHNVGAGPSGELVGVGWQSDGDGDSQIWVGKYDTELALLWETTFDGTTVGDDNGWGVVVDEDGVITLVGGIVQAGNGYDAWIAQLAP